MALIEVLEFDAAEQVVEEGQDGLELLSLPRTEMLEREVPTYEMLELAEQGPPGPPGPPGQTGPAGADGAGLRILDVLASTVDLPTSAQAGDAYLVGTNGWLWNGAAWKDMGPIQGPRGKDGQIRFTGNGPPPAVIVGSEPGDIYLDLLTGDTYKLT